MWCYVMLYYTILYYTMLCYVMLLLLCYAMVYYVTLYYTMLYYVILCYTMLYYVILCYTMLYYNVLLLINWYIPLTWAGCWLLWCWILGFFLCKRKDAAICYTKCYASEYIYIYSNIHMSYMQIDMSMYEYIYTQTAYLIDESLHLLAHP